MTSKRQEQAWIMQTRRRMTDVVSREGHGQSASESAGLVEVSESGVEAA